MPDSASAIPSITERSAASTVGMKKFTVQQLRAVFLGGLFPQHERGGVGFEPFQLHPPHGFPPAETFLRVEYFQPGQPAFAVVISRDRSEEHTSELQSPMYL